MLTYKINQNNQSLVIHYDPYRDDQPRIIRFFQLFQLDYLNVFISEHRVMVKVLELDTINNFCVYEILRMLLAFCEVNRIHCQECIEEDYAIEDLEINPEIAQEIEWEEDLSEATTVALEDDNVQ